MKKQMFKDAMLTYSRCFLGYLQSCLICARGAKVSDTRNLCARITCAKDDWSSGGACVKDAYTEGARIGNASVRGACVGHTIKQFEIYIQSSRILQLR